MIVQLVSSMSVASSSVTFNLEGHFIPPPPFTVQLMDLTICSKVEHEDTHFPKKLEGDYPPREEAWPETIKVRVPKAQTVKRTIPTIQLSSSAEEGVQEEEEEEEIGNKRKKRSPAETRAGEAAIEKEEEDLENQLIAQDVAKQVALSDWALIYTALFILPQVILRVSNIAQVTADAFLAKLNGYQANKARDSFQRLIDVPIKFQTQADPASNGTKVHVSIRIKSNFVYGFSDPRLWYALGFTDDDLALDRKLVGDTLFYVTTSEGVREKVVKAHSSITKTRNLASLVATAMSKFPPESLQSKLGSTLDPQSDYVQLYNGLYKHETEGALELPERDWLLDCNPSSQGASKLLKALIDRIARELVLTENVLRVMSVDKSTSLRRIVTDASTPRKHNFVIKIFAGHQLARHLGLPVRPANRTDASRLLWWVGRGDWVSEPFDEINEESLACENATLKISDYFYTGKLLPAPEPQPLPPAVAVDIPEDPVAIPVNPELQPEEEIDNPEQEQEQIEEEIVNPEQAVLAPEQEQIEEIEEEALGEEEEGIEGGGDVSQAALSEEDDDFDEIEIPNPLPVPPTKFVLANQRSSGRCVPPADFPERCTIFLREAEQQDYVTERGRCSILGVLRDSVPKLVSRSCLVSSPFVQTLTLEFSDDHLNTYSPSTRGAYIKADLVIVPSQRS